MLMKRGHDGFIPIPDIDQYSDMVSIHQLGLPIGFDEASIGFNLNLAERIRSICGLGQLNMTVEAAEQNHLDVMPVSNQGGIASAAVRASVAKPAAYRFNKPDIDETYLVINRPDVTVRLNSNSIDEQIAKREKRSGAGQYDPHLRAKALNQIGTTALRDVVRERLLPRDRMLNSVGWYAGCEFWWNIFPPHDDFIGGGISGVMCGVLANGLSWASNRQRGALPSVIPVAPVDRYLVARAAMTGPRLFKPLKPTGRNVTIL